MEKWLVTLVLVVPVIAAEADQPLFDSHETVKLTLTAEFSKVFEQRDETTSTYHPATLTITNNDGNDSGTATSLDIEIKTRGEFRLRRENCLYPPLFWKIDPASAAGTVFEGQHILPVTTHCRDTVSYRQYLLQEYLLYRTHALLTEKSMRVRLLRIEYVNARKSRRRGEYYAFAVEHFDDIAKRADSRRVEPDRFDPLIGDPYDTVLMNVFQYMIGNTDWSAVFPHNIMLLEDIETAVISPVPFDFNNSGVVDGEYAVPGDNLRIRSVRQRLYRGFCRPDEQYRPVFERFIEMQPAIYILLENQEGLSKGERRRTIRYYDLFYDALDSPEESRKKIIGACRQPLARPTGSLVQLGLAGQGLPRTRRGEAGG